MLEIQEQIRGLSSGFVSAGSVTKERFDVKELGIRSEDLPLDLRNMNIPPELQKRLVGRSENAWEGKKDAIFAEMRRFKGDQDQRRTVIEAINAHRRLIGAEMALSPAQIVVVDSADTIKTSAGTPEKSQIPSLTNPTQSQKTPASVGAEKP